MEASAKNFHNLSKATLKAIQVAKNSFVRGGR